MALHLPEYPCPSCGLSVTLVPVAGRHPETNRCAVCGARVVLLPDGELARPLPSDVTLDVREDAFEVAIEDWFSTFGAADRALRYRIEREALVWSTPPLLGRIRFHAEWSRLPRAALSRIDVRAFERGMRGTSSYETWLDLVFVAHDTSEAASGHRFHVDEDLRQIATLLEWAHDAGVPSVPRGDAVYRALPPAAGRPLVLIDASGRVTRLAPAR